MDEETFDISAVFPNIAIQLRSALANMHLAAAQLAPCRLPAVFPRRYPRPGLRLYSCPTGPPGRREGFFAPGLVS